MPEAQEKLQFAIQDGLSVPQERRVADRRSMSLSGFLVGGFKPRRRKGRRGEDRHALVDWHEPQLLIAAIMILLLSTADAFLTLNILFLGGEELNPFMAWMLNRNLLLFTTVKMLLTGGGVIILVATARARLFNATSVARIMHGFVAAYMMLVGYEWVILDGRL